MIRKQWQKISDKVDAMTMRERVLVFAAIAFLLITLVNVLLLDPLLLKQKVLLAKVVQQQEKIKEVQAQMDAIMQAKNVDEKSPQRQRISMLKEELTEGEAYLKSNREKLVQPEKMAELMRQVLSKNSSLQLVALQTLPVTPLLEKTSMALENTVTAAPGVVPESQIFKHGVELTVRGNYLDLLNYLTSLERLPTQMFWGKASLAVTQYPAAELTLRLYTLSLDKTWLQI